MIRLNYKILLSLLLVISIIGCRKQIVATEEEMANYGWELFEQGDYIQSAEWFQQSIVEDSLYKDGYNGLGWSLGKIMLPDSGIKKFLEGLPLDQSRNITVEIDKEIKAGLCFSYSALGNDTSAISYGTSLLNQIDALPVPDWKFSHDTTLNHLDLRLTLAVSYFAQGNFLQSVIYIQDILKFLDPSAVFEADTTTAGQQVIAEQLETLQSILH